MKTRHKKLTSRDYGSQGGKTRWKNQKKLNPTSYKQQRSEIMREVIRARYQKRAKLKVHSARQ